MTKGVDVVQESVLDGLSGIRLQLYLFLVRTSSPVGPSEVMRALDLKTASHASYHLAKLYELGIVDKTPQNTYFLRKEYIFRSIRANVLIDYFLINGKFWPKNAFLAAFVVLVLAISLVLSILGYFLVLKVFLGLALIPTGFLLLKDVVYQMKLLNGGMDRG